MVRQPKEGDVYEYTGAEPATPSRLRTLQRVGRVYRLVTSDGQRLGPSSATLWDFARDIKFYSYILVIPVEETIYG